ncbi:MAG: HNH endonuclease signature motif containing protein [Lachnospiraceae bacterium]|nr:HNH endonuclease signature motif containing protein [Lachnospiraceae bacterium]
MMKYSKDMIRFIEKNVSGLTTYDLTELFNRHFGTDVKQSQIKSLLARYKLTNGINCKFKKGQEPHNKGQKGITYKGSEKGWFKKGNVSPNHKAVGSERLSKDGYFEIKVAEPNKWRLKHNVIWEEAHGAIPKGCVVVFLDGNKENVEVGNLKLITRRELLIMNRHGLFTPNAETTETACNLAKLIDTRNSVKKGRTRHEN